MKSESRKYAAFFFLLVSLFVMRALYAQNGDEVLLSIEIQMDLLDDELSVRREENDHEGIIEVIKRIRSLVAPAVAPDNLYWLEAQALQATDELLAADKQLNMYLHHAGQDGEFYVQARRMLRSIAPAVERRREEEAEVAAILEEEIARELAKANFLRTKDAQRLFDQLGFPVAVTGNLDKVTMEAAAVYQVRNDLTVNGEITDELMDRLKSAVPDSHDCDALAHYSLGADDWYTMTFERMEAARATFECNDALRKYPDVVRFKIQYARALAASGRSKEAIIAADDLTRQGYPAAAYLAGELHSSGQLQKSGRPDHEKALQMYLLAAEQNYARAQVKMGSIYATGNRGVRRNGRTALSWYQKAAKQNYVHALMEIARIYESGKGGISRDYVKALDWYKLAGDLNYAAAQYKAGEMYERGRGTGTGRDKKLALEWYTRAAENGYRKAPAKVKLLSGNKV